MKYIILAALVSLSVSSAAYADQAFYVSPTGNDSNNCLSPATACKSPNRVLAYGINHDVTSALTVNFDVGNYYSPPFWVYPDGGQVDGGGGTLASTDYDLADGKALMDIEGYNISGNGLLNIVCSTQQINTAGQVAGVTDGGTIGNYEAWVLASIDGGWGNYASDAGFCFPNSGGNSTLGTAATYAVLGSSTVTNTGSSVLTGNLGLYAGTSVTGFPPGTVSGTKNVANAAAQQAQIDAQSAFTTLSTVPGCTDLSGQDLGGMYLDAGTYCFSSTAAITGTLTLNGRGNPASRWIFQVGSALTTASSSVVALDAGADACNVYWTFGSSATLGTSSVMQGTLLAHTSITATTSAAVTGNLLAQTGAVTLDTNAVALPAGCFTAADAGSGADGGSPACNALVANSLVGKFIQITSGAGAGEIAPIVSNTTNTITYVNHSIAFGSNPPAPDATSAFNLFAPASHFYPYPVDAGVTNAYAAATIWAAGNSTASGADGIYAASGATRIFSSDPAITISYCDFADAPQGTNSNLEVLDNFGPTLLSARYNTIETTADGSGAVNYAGTLELAGDYVSAAAGNADINSLGGTTNLTGDLLSTSPISSDGSTITLYNDVLQPSAGTIAVGGYLASKVTLQSSLLNSNNTTLAGIKTQQGTNVYLNNVAYQTDGGAGLLSCGAGGNNSIISTSLLDAGVNLVSLDNGVTWTTATGFSVQDGGSAGVHATCNQGSGCCYTNY